MFEFFRTHTRLLLIILVLLVFPAFALFGVQGYTQFTEGSVNKVATVDGHPITQAEWDEVHQRQVERVRQEMPDADAKTLDSPEFRRQTLEALVRERVQLAAARKQHIVATDERLQRVFQNDPQFAFLRNQDKGLNTELLTARGMTAAQFEKQLRQDLIKQQVFGGLTDSAIEAAVVGSMAVDALLQRREVQLRRFDSQAYLAGLNPSEADLVAYYNDPTHQVQFRAPEQADIEYVVLDLPAVTATLAVSEDDLRKYYEENLARYTVAEERRASHILIKADKDQSAADRAKAKARAEELLQQLRQTPSAFSDLAKKYSEDPLSAARGGDLEFFGRGAMDKAIEDAVFAMKQGEIGNLVASDFGYHIVRLDAVRGGEKKAFSAVRSEIEDEVKKQLAQKKFAEAAEQFSNLVYEQSDSLQPVIDRLRLVKQKATVRRTPAPGVGGVLASAKFLEAVFGNEVLRNKHNTNAIEIGANQLVSARVLQYTPARVLPLQEVAHKVREQVLARQAADLARKDGQAYLDKLKRGEEATDLPATVTLSRAQPQGLPGLAVDGLLRADATKLPAVIGVDIGAQGYIVARIEKVHAPDPKSPEVEQLRPRVEQAWAVAEAQAYYAALKRRYKVDMKHLKEPSSGTAASAIP